MARIGIRADGGTGIGMGHIMRCMSLAKSFTQAGDEVFFFSQAQLGIETLEKAGFLTIPIGLAHSVNSAGEQLARVLQEYQIDVLIVDSYQVTTTYFEILKPSVGCLVYIDDENKQENCADMIINGNITAEYLHYRKFQNGQQFLLGPQYNMIRDEFRGIPPHTTKQMVENLMITTGGTDPYDTTKQLLLLLLAAEGLQTMELHVVVGSGFQNRQELTTIAAHHPRVKLYSTNPEEVTETIRYSSMRDLMLFCDMAISAGGSTLYEFAACGTPVLAFILADNQAFLVDIMQRLGYIRSLGWHNKLQPEGLKQQVLQLAEDYRQRACFTKKSQLLVDGLGTERIVEQIRRHLSKK